MWYVDGIGLVKTPRGLTIDGVQHPRNILTLWTKAELAAIGIKPASITAVDHRYKNTGEIGWNTDGSTYQYYAVAASPFKYANAR